MLSATETIASGKRTLARLTGILFRLLLWSILTWTSQSLLPCDLVAPSLVLRALSKRVLFSLDAYHQLLVHLLVHWTAACRPCLDDPCSQTTHELSGTR